MDGRVTAASQEASANAPFNLFRSFCRPILNKPKPKAATTEAPKKEEPKKQQQSEKEPEANGDAEITELDDEAEAKKPDMDVD